MFKFGNHIRYKGFTLVEILIVLGVIGIVSAITLPSVIHKIQMSVLQIQFKKAYSILNNAIEKTKVDTEYTLVCNSSEGNDCTEFHNQLEKNLKILKKCKTKSFENGCIGDVKGINQVIIDENSTNYNNIYPFYLNSHIKNSNQSFLVSNGMSVIYYSRKLRGMYAVDINGLKGPNRWGYDVFAFGLSENGHKLMCSYYLNEFFEKGGKSCKDMMINNK